MFYYYCYRCFQFHKKDNIDSDIQNNGQMVYYRHPFVYYIIIILYFIILYYNIYFTY